MHPPFCQVWAVGLVLTFFKSVNSNPDGGAVQMMFSDSNTECADGGISTSDNGKGNQMMFEQFYDLMEKYSLSLNKRQDYMTQLQNNGDYGDAVKECQESQPKPKPCDPDSPYRTYDGSCNNLNHPTWGMKGECIQRVLPPAYEGSHGMRRSVSGGPLPPPRYVSNNLLSNDDSPSPTISYTFTIFGQFIAHEISSSTPDIGDKSKPYCCPASDNMDDQCCPILIDKDDPFYQKYGVTCISITRTPPCNSCTVGKRQQANQVTPVLDCSNVYGTKEEDANKLRKKDGTGRLKFEEGRKGDLLPGKANTDKRHCPMDPIKEFKAGDKRVNQHTGLMSQHTLFMREHNRIALILKNMNIGWDDDRLYQESRKIVGAELQSIVYKEHLPLLIGPELMQENDLWIGNDGQGTCYDPDVHLGAWAECSTAAYRLHSMVSHVTGSRNLSFEDWYFDPKLIRQGEMEILLTGLENTPAQQFGVNLVDDMRNNLLKRSCYKKGYDMASVTIQRGRDHGLPPYVDLVRYLSMGKVDITSFDDLLQLMNPKDVENLRKTYQSVYDIDLWVGMQKERPAKGAIVGPTAGRALAQQFQNLKYGDRFYFEHDGERPSFTRAQVEELKKCSYSRFVCDNTKITKIQKNAMLLPDANNPVVSCDSLPQMDFSLWKE